jgi:triosephosphate isomerase
MRKPLIAANFKMNKTLKEAIDYFNEFKELTRNENNSEIVIAVPSLLLHPILKIVENTNIKLSAQNVHWEDSGAFTGETSPLTLKDMGIPYTVLGHSERRQMFCETDETVNKRLLNALKNGLKVIFCIGESLFEREENKTIEKINKQITDGLKNVSKDMMKNIAIAYEPIWAIGTGKTATPEQAQEVHKEIRKILSKMFNENIADETRILYGGSVKPANIKELMNQNDIDGALVGGASLKTDSFIKIVKYYD